MAVLVVRASPFPAGKRHVDGTKNATSRDGRAGQRSNSSLDRSYVHLATIRCPRTPRARLRVPSAADSVMSIHQGGELPPPGAADLRRLSHEFAMVCDVEGRVVWSDDRARADLDIRQGTVLPGLCVSGTGGKATELIRQA